MQYNLNPEFADRAIDLLNEALLLDRVAVENLINFRTPCNNDMAEHESIQVKQDRNIPELITVGFIGLLNGICGIDDNNCGGIAAVINDAGQLVRFARYNQQ